MQSKKAKIIATVGPASRSKEMLWKLHQAGANIFRLNFSHGAHSDHQMVIDWVRELNQEHGTNICLLQDLQGPKIRTNQIVDGGVEIKRGDLIKIEAGDFEGNAERISTTYETIAQDVKAGETILIDDGNLELVVKETDGKAVTCEVIFGGTLKSRKGINLPETDINQPALTEKDREDLLFGIEQGVDWIALSFVRSAKDLMELKEIVEAKGKDIKVVSKIEKPEAIENMDEIIEITDGLMVARGDLGVEVDMAKVPLIQKELITKCNAAGKPVIVATQMLESMITNPRPTRAEAGDVANAIIDGADVVMLSAESAAGDFPIESVTAMARIIKDVEDNAKDIYHKYYDIDPTSDTVLSDSLLLSACKVAEFTHAKAVVCMSESGYSAQTISSHRPDAHIYVFTPDDRLVTRLSLVWGVTAFHYDGNINTDATLEEVKNILLSKGLVEKGDAIVHTASMPSWKKARTNMVKVATVE